MKQTMMSYLVKACCMAALMASFAMDVATAATASQPSRHLRHLQDGTSDSGDSGQTPDPIDENRGDGSFEDIDLMNILYYFLSGSVVVVAIVTSTYILANIMDKYCNCFGDDLALSGEEMEFRLTSSQLARKAGLSTIKPEERVQVLQKFFTAAAKTYEGAPPSADAKDSSKAADEDALDQKPKATASRRRLTQRRNSSNASSRHIIDRINSSRSLNVKAAATQEVELTEINKAAATEEDVEAQTNTEEPAPVQKQPSQRQLDKELEELADMEHVDGTCAICLTEYEHGEKIMSGTTCEHMFHFNCCMEWMTKGHDHCPFCRKFMIQPDQFREEAVVTLGAKRVERLRRLDHFAGAQSAVEARIQEQVAARSAQQAEEPANEEDEETAAAAVTEEAPASESPAPEEESPANQDTNSDRESTEDDAAETKAQDDASAEAETKEGAGEKESTEVNDTQEQDDSEAETKDGASEKESTEVNDTQEQDGAEADAESDGEKQEQTERDESNKDEATQSDQTDVDAKGDKASSG